MKRFGSVKFDFITNRVQIGRSWVNGLTMDKKAVRLTEKVPTMARREQIASVRCGDKLALLAGDFTPKPTMNINGIYGPKARVIPNLDGIFQISLLNTTEIDVTINSRKTIGFIRPTERLACKIDNDSCDFF